MKFYILVFGIIGHFFLELHHYLYKKSSFLSQYQLFTEAFQEILHDTY